MNTAKSHFDLGSRTLSYVFGGVVLALAVGTMMTSERPLDIAHKALEVFGAAYLLVLGVLIFATLFCWSQQKATSDPSKRQVWTEAGLHAAGGVSTLALTFTLLGISLGIGTLADQELSPDTVQAIIGDLTRHFSMAFMTTVVGLPISAALQALVKITESKMNTLYGRTTS